MTGPPIEQLLRDAALRARGSDKLPPKIFQRVLRRQRRLRRATTAGGVFSVAAITAVTIGVASHLTGGVSRSPIQPTTHRSASNSPAAAPERFAPLAPPAVPTASSEPAAFFGAVGAGDERLAVISSSSGNVARYLQSTGSQDLSVFNDSGTVSYQPSPAGCAATWTATNLATGAQQPAFTDLERPAEVALSPTGQRIAYLSVGKQRRIVTSDGQRIPAGCPTARQTLVIADRSTGQQERIPAGYAGQDWFDLAFNRTATDLAFMWHRRVRILDLANDTSLEEAATLPDRPGCQQHHPAFRPGNDQLLVEQDCASDVEIDGYNPTTLALDYRHVVTRVPHSILASFGVDPSGQYVIYSVDIGDKPASPSGAVFAVEPTGDRHITDGVYQVDW